MTTATEGQVRAARRIAELAQQWRRPVPNAVRRIVEEAGPVQQLTFTASTGQRHWDKTEPAGARTVVETGIPESSGLDPDVREVLDQIAQLVSDGRLSPAQVEAASALALSEPYTFRLAAIERRNMGYGIEDGIESW